jgi:hypothetical protein
VSVNRPSVSAVLFDFDGTLLGMDTDRFIEAYVRLLARWFEPWVDPARFARHLLAATRTMIDNRDPSRTSREVFAGVFYPALDTTEDAMAPRLFEFYEREYPRLRGTTSPDPEARRAVAAVLDRGLAAVCAWPAELQGEERQPILGERDLETAGGLAHGRAQDPRDVAAAGLRIDLELEVQVVERIHADHSLRRPWAQIFPVDCGVPSW